MSDHTRRPQRRTPKALQVVAAIGFTIAGVLLYCMSINMFGNSPLNLALTWVGVSVLSVFAIIVWVMDERRSLSPGDDDDD